MSFYLMVDGKFLYCFLVDKWLRAFADHPGFRGVLVREDLPAANLVQRRRAFHGQHLGKRQLTPEMDAELSAFYPDFGTESRTSIGLYGIPRHTFAHAESFLPLGSDLNGDTARQWAESTLRDDNTWVFSHVGQILAPWWIDCCEGRLLNMHSAVLPYARGANAIQQIAALGDEKLLRRAAGATVHYIDPGIDTGALIRAERLNEPLAYDNLWQLVAAIYELGDALYVRVAQDILAHPESRPAGFKVADADQGPNYLRRQFTPERRLKAETAFLNMREAWLDGRQ